MQLRYLNLEYLLYVIPAYLFVLAIQIWLRSTISRYSKIPAAMTGVESAGTVLRISGVYGVNVVQTEGNLTDNFDPSSSVIYLSKSVYGVRSVAAVGIAAHEAGHAVQHYEEYGPAKLRQAAVGVCNIGSRLSVPLIIAGYIFSMPVLIYAGIVCFGLIVAFQLITLPVEFNASRRAVKILSESGMITDDELKGVKRVLTAAAMTYVGALALSSVQMLFYISRVKRK